MNKDFAFALVNKLKEITRGQIDIYSLEDFEQVSTDYEAEFQLAYDAVIKDYI